MPTRAARHIVRLVLGLAAAVAILVSAPASAQQGTCASFDFFNYTASATGVLDDDGYRSVVIADRMPVYAQPTGGTPMVRNSDIRFRDAVRIRQITGPEGGASRIPTRVRIEEIGSQNEIGWVDAAGLLCATKPLKTAEGMERRAFIKTADARADAVAVVTAYPRPVGDECDGRCTELGAFNLYFVFGEQDGRLLLAENYVLNYGEGLVGWIDKVDPVTRAPLALPWKTGIGLRPREDLTWTRPDGKTEEGTVCAFPEREQAVAHSKTGAETGCRPILGGNDWFALPLRMALLDTRDGIHEVAMHAVGFGQGRTAQGVPAMVDPKQTLEQSRLSADATKTLDNLKRADVFFLVDGTESMKNTLDTIKGKPGQPGAVDAILDQLRDKMPVGTHLRYGFRMYGDTSRHPGNPYGTTGLGEGMPLSGACDGDDQPAANHEAFKARFSKVQVRNVVSAEALEDYAENVNGGIEQALTDMAACPDRLKILFVFGDNGYNRAKQAERGFRVIDAANLIGLARNRFKERIVVFFVQPPRDQEIGGKSDYQRAYKLFTDQAEDFLRQFYKGRSFDPGAAFIAMERNGRVAVRYEDLTRELTRAVDRGANPQAVEAVAINIRSGQSVRRAVESAKTAYPTVPGWFWDLVSKETCDVLGAQCDKDMFQAVPIFYIPQTVKGAPTGLVTEIWMTQDGLAGWVNFLSMFEERERGDEARKRLVANVTKVIEETIKMNFKETGETFQEYFSRHGYFKDALMTPLMRYSPDDLRNPDVLKPCEFEHLRLWALSSRDLLRIVQTPGQRPRYKAEFGATDCPLSERGQRIPYLRDRAQGVPLAPGVAGAAFGQRFNKRAVIYWIPQEFMP